MSYSVKIKELEKLRKQLTLKTTKEITMKEWNDISYQVREINSSIEHLKFLKEHKEIWKR